MNDSDAELNMSHPGMQVCASPMNLGLMESSIGKSKNHYVSLEPATRDVTEFRSSELTCEALSVDIKPGTCNVLLPIFSCLFIYILYQDYLCLQISFSPKKMSISESFTKSMTFSTSFLSFTQQ